MMAGKVAGPAVGTDVQPVRCKDRHPRLTWSSASERATRRRLQKLQEFAARTAWDDEAFSFKLSLKRTKAVELSRTDGPAANRELK